MRCLIFLFAWLSLSGCASMPRTADIPLTGTTHTIYVIYRGWHTSILLDAKTLAAQSPFLATNLRNEKYARVGFGDGDYFTGKDKSISSATKALFLSGYSALQLLTYDYAPFDEIPADTIVPLAVSDEGMRRLIQHINNSIALNNERAPISLPALSGAMGSFYQGNVHYSAFSNCNTWTGQALRVAGLPVANRLTASGVFAQAKAISIQQASAGLFNNRNLKP